MTQIKEGEEEDEVRGERGTQTGADRGGGDVKMGEDG